MSRLPFSRLALVLLPALGFLLVAGPAAAQVVVTPAPQPTQALPLASLENWSVLLLESGILYTRVAGSQEGPFFVFAARDKFDGVELLAYRGGPDAPGAFGALDIHLGLSARDLAALKAFALKATLSPTGYWDAFTFGDGYLIADDPALGELGPRLKEALLVLEASGFVAKMAGASAAASSKDAVVVDTHACLVQQWTANEITSGTVVVGSATGSSTFPKVKAVSSASSKAFTTAAALCVAGQSPYYGEPPAFPTTVPGYPTTTVPWEGTSCSPVGSTTAGCMQKSTGDYCTQCTCTDAWPHSEWVKSGNCAPVTPTAPNTGCAPAGNDGPCSKGTKTCRCSCTATTPPAPPGNVWTDQRDCGSAGLAAAFALAAFGVAWRRRAA